MSVLHNIKLFVWLAFFSYMDNPVLWFVFREGSLEVVHMLEKSVAEQLMQVPGDEWSDFLYTIHPTLGVSSVRPDDLSDCCSDIEWLIGEFLFKAYPGMLFVSMKYNYYRFSRWHCVDLQKLKLSDVFLRRVFQPGVRQPKALQEALEQHGRPISDSDLASVSLDALRSHIFSAIESEVWSLLWHDFWCCSVAVLLHLHFVCKQW